MTVPKSSRRDPGPPRRAADPSPRRAADPSPRRALSSRAAEVSIDRLAIRVPGLDQEDARALARLLAEELAPRIAGGANGRLDTIRLELIADAADPASPVRLAQRIAAEIAHTLPPEHRANGGPAR